MKSVITTNKAIPYFNYQSIDAEFDIFCLETSKEYIDYGAAILDTPLLNKEVKAVLFESGRRFFVLLRHDPNNRTMLKSVLLDADYGSSLSLTQIKSKELCEYQLLQLLINGLAAKNHPELKFNNLTGKFYVFTPSSIIKSNDFIAQVVALEIKVLDNCHIMLNVRTFTSTKLRKKISFDKKKFESYPKYILSSDNSMRRKTSEDNKSPDFILRQLDGKKSKINFFKMRSAKSYEDTKVAALANVVETFNTRYQGKAEISFQTISDYITIDTSKAKKAAQKKKTEKSLLADIRINIIDYINTQQSQELCKTLIAKIMEKYGCKAKVGSRLSHKALNIRLIHNMDYYKDGEADPHQDDTRGYIVQHITLEDFFHDKRGVQREDISAVLSAVIHELIIKDDISKGRLSLFDWTSLGFDRDIAFGLTDGEKDPRYFFMTIKPDGTFFFSEQERNLLEWNEYSTCVQIFENKQIEGVVKYSDEDILAIGNNRLYTLPEYQAIYEELRSGNTHLRNLEAREKYLTSVTEIRKYRLDNKDYYFSGISGQGMDNTPSTATLIRSVEQVKSGSSTFDELLPLMNVFFVRNMQLTVIPFPYKYLREWIEANKDL